MAGEETVRLGDLHDALYEKNPATPPSLDAPWFEVDGMPCTFEAPRNLVGRRGYAFGANPKRLAQLCEWIDVEYLWLKSCHATDLTPLQSLTRLRGLRIEYAPKLRNITPLARIDGLRALHFEACTNLRDFAALCDAPLTVVCVEGGMWKTHYIESLSPFAAMPRLEQLVLDGMTIEDGNIAVVTRSESLRHFQPPMGMPLEDYAYLAAHRPDLLGAGFDIFTKYEATGRTTLVLYGKGLGRRRTFDAVKDAARIGAIREEFRRLVEAQSQ